MSEKEKSEKHLEAEELADTRRGRLDNPDVAKARGADKKTIKEAGKSNPDSWMSAEGHFAIVDHERILASRDVAESSMNRPAGGFEKATRPDGSIELKGVIPGQALDESNLINEIGEVIGKSSKECLQEQDKRALGATIGTVQSLGELTMDFVNIGEFVGDVIIGNVDRAAQKGAKFGEAIGKTMVAGVNVFKAAHKYLYDVGFEGDYSKPFRDVLALGWAIEREWSNLPPIEQERLKFKLATDVIAGAVPIGGAAKITEAQKVTTALEEAALLGRQLRHGERASLSIEKLIADLFQLRKKGDPSIGISSIINDVEKQVAGAPGGHWEVIDEVFAVEDEVFRQKHVDSCTSAAVEMITDGRVSQQQMIDLMSRPGDVETAGRILSKILEPGWEGGYVGPANLDALLQRGPFVADLKTTDMEMAHSVLVEGVTKDGLFKIKDPWQASRYKLSSDVFHEVWTGNVLFFNR